MRHQSPQYMEKSNLSIMLCDDARQILTIFFCLWLYEKLKSFYHLLLTCAHGIRVYFFFYVEKAGTFFS